MLTELWSEKFEWFGPSPIEPFVLAGHGGEALGAVEVAVLDGDHPLLAEDLLRVVVDELAWAV